VEKDKGQAYTKVVDLYKGFKGEKQGKGEN
jgi:hypothetical protein